MQVLLTGLTSSMGVHVCDFLLQQNYEVIAPIRSKFVTSTSRNDNNLRIHLLPEGADMINFSMKVLNDCHPDVVIHLAAISRESAKVSHENYRCVNVEWPLQLFNALAKLKKKTKFIFVSTVGVYGNPPNLICSEENLLQFEQFNPLGCYHSSKLEAEKKLLTASTEASAAQLVILRSSIIYGVQQSGFLDKVFALYRRFMLATPRTFSWTLTSMDNFITYVNAAIHSKHQRDLIWNAVDSGPLNREVIRKLANIRGCIIPLPFSFTTNSKFLPTWLRIKINLLFNSWEFHPPQNVSGIKNFEQAIQKMSGRYFQK